MADFESEKGPGANKSFELIRAPIQRAIGRILASQVVPSHNNEVSQIRSEEGDFILKIYDETHSKRASAGREIQISKLLQALPEIPKMLLSDTSKRRIPHDFAVFEHVKGQTLRSLVEGNTLTDKELSEIANKVSAFIQKVSQIQTQKFGRLDESGLKGTSESWVTFLSDMQENAIRVLRNHNLLPDEIYVTSQQTLNRCASNLMVKDPRLFPMDMNMNNILVNSDHEIKYVDLKTFWSGDPLFSHSHFYALTDGTRLGNIFGSKLFSTTEDAEKVRYYALLDLLHALAYVVRVNPTGAQEAKPWGNPNRFVDLISQQTNHLRDR